MHDYMVLVVCITVWGCARGVGRGLVKGIRLHVRQFDRRKTTKISGNDNDNTDADHANGTSICNTSSSNHRRDQVTGVRMYSEPPKLAKSGFKAGRRPAVVIIMMMIMITILLLLLLLIIIIIIHINIFITSCTISIRIHMFAKSGFKASRRPRRIG